ncbi:DNA polymerase Y family protein [Stenotrophomonas sp. NPDC087984]
MPLVGAVPLGTRAATPPPASAEPPAPGARGDARPLAPGESSAAAGEGTPGGPGAVSSAAPAEAPADASASGGPAGTLPLASDRRADARWGAAVAGGAAAAAAREEGGHGREAAEGPSAEHRDRASGGVGSGGEVAEDSSAGSRAGGPGGGGSAGASGGAAGTSGDSAGASGGSAERGGGSVEASGGGGGRAPGEPGHEGEVPHVLYVRFHPAPGEDVYQGLLTLLGELTPVVEALPPDAAFADVRGALRYFGRDAAGLAEIVRVRALARYGVDCTVGVAANPLLARMAAQEAQEPGAPASRGGRSGGGSGARSGGGSGRAAGSVRTVPGDPDAVAAFLARKPPIALPGVGPATARTLSAYGLDSAARIAAAPLSTLQRILGAATARRVHAWARGIDPAPVTPNAPARAMGAEHRFRHDELDPVRRRRALLTLADGLGVRMRTSGQVAAAISLTVRYADRSTTTRSRTLTEPTAHTPALTAAAYALHDALGLQRARVRSVALRFEGLMNAELASHQLTFDPADEKSRRLEAAADRARARFGISAVRPAGFLDVA